MAERTAGMCGVQARLCVNLGAYLPPSTSAVTLQLEQLDSAPV